MYELKNCPVCGASEINRIGKVIAGDKEFAKYRCSSCDAEFSAYQKYQREMAAAKKAAEKAAAARVSEQAAPTAAPKAKAASDWGEVQGLGASTRPTPPAKPVAKPAPKVAPSKVEGIKTEASAPVVTPTVNVAASVYKKAINSTVSVVARGKGVQRNGTGTMVSDSGYLLTNAHVIMSLSSDHKTVLDESQSIYIKSGKSATHVSAELIYADPSIDLALLKTKENKVLVPVTMELREPDPGEDVYAIGNSKGEGLCIVEGIVSDTHRLVAGNEYVMISAPVTNGNSGGPVFNAAGNLIGIVQSGRADVSAMNYAIPVDVIQAFLSKAKKEKHCNF